MDLLKYEVPWSELQSLFQEKYGFNGRGLFKLVDFLFDNGLCVDWNELPDWLELDDPEILQRIGWKYKSEEELYVTTSISFRKGGGPFKLKASSLEEFVREHHNVFDWHIFDFDTMIISFKSNYIWALNHNGDWTNIDLSQFKAPS